jgi:Fe-S oxidoreductase
MGMAMCKILDNAGYSIDIPDKSVCCGLPAIASGDRKSAEKSISKNIPYMKTPDKYSYYLTLCPSCGSTIQEDFCKFTLNNPDLYKKADKIKQKVISFGEFLEKENIKLEISENKKVTYHTPCHLKRGMGYNTETFLEKILGENFIKCEDSDVCCGFGGSYSIDFAEISSGILNKKLENIRKTDAEILITDCPGCVMQIQGGAEKNNMSLEVIHLSEFIDKYLKI